MVITGLFSILKGDELRFPLIDKLESGSLEFSSCIISNMNCPLASDAFLPKAVMTIAGQLAVDRKADAVVPSSAS